MSNESVCRIVFVDSDTDWLGSVVRTLKEQGIRALRAADIGKVERASNRSLGRQLVFVDLGFAERVPDQLRHFAQSENRYVVVLSPVHLTSHRMSRIFKLGVYDCVDKPYDAPSLKRLVESLTKEVCPSTRDTASSATLNCVPA